MMGRLFKDINMSITKEVYERLKKIIDQRTLEENVKESLVILEYQKATGEIITQDVAKQMLRDFDSITDDERWDGEEQLYRQEELDEMGRLGRIDIKDDPEGNE